VNPFTRKVRAVIRREFMQRVRSKWFLLSTLGIPALMVGLVFLAGFFVSQSDEDLGRTSTIGVVDPSGRVADVLVEELLADSVLAARAEAFADATEEDVRSGLSASPYDVLLLLPPDILEPPPEDEADRREPGERAKLFASDNVPPAREREVRDALSRALVRVRLAEAGVEGVDAEALLRSSPISVVNVTQTGEGRSQDLYRGISFAIDFLFYMVLLIYGQMIIRSIIEEKSSDIVEVMVSSLRPWELMLGKIVGVGAVGLAQLAVWAAVLAVTALFGMTSAGAALAEAGFDVTTIAIPWGTTALVLLFLVLGYLLYAGLFAGTGATISSETDAQQAALPVTLLIVVPFIAVQGIIQSPNSPWAVVFSLVPFFSPLAMPPRLMISTVPVWQIAASVLLLAACVLVAAWVAGRIYRVGILMKGQRANLPEVVRWVRHG